MFNALGYWQEIMTQLEPMFPIEHKNGYSPQADSKVQTPFNLLLLQE